MNRTYKLFLISLALVFCLAGNSPAQEIVTTDDNVVGARAMGMGGAQIASVNDLTAVIHNPAALARFDKTEVQFSMSLLKRSITTTLTSTTGNPSKGIADGITDWSGLGTLGIAYPVPTDRGSLVFAIAYNRLKDFTGRFLVDGYNDDLIGNQRTESIEDGGMGILSLAGAVDVSPNVSFGASFDIWMGSYKRDNRLLLNDFPEDWSQLDITGVDDNIAAWSFKPSVLYHKDKFRFGAYARLPMRFHIDEDNYLEWYSRDDGEFLRLYELIDPSSQWNDEYIRDKMNYTIDAPMQLGFGMAWGRPGISNFAFDITYENWTQAKLNYPSDYVTEPNYFRDKYRPVVNWRVGLEQRLPLFGLVGRVGYMRRPLSFKGPRSYEENAPQIITENERDYLTFGIGKTFDGIMNLDVGYIHGFWSEKESARLDEEVRRKLFVSLTYRM